MVEIFRASITAEQGREMLAKKRPEDKPWDAAQQSQLNEIARLKRAIREYRIWWVGRFGDVKADCPELAKLFKAAE